MSVLLHQLLQTTTCARKFLDKSARREVAKFIRSRMNPDGGFCGRDQQSDLYYTFFAVAALRALGSPIPLFKLWKFIKLFGRGETLDAVHFSCFVQLRSIFPMGKKTRRDLFQRLETLPAETPYDAFLKWVAAEGSTEGSADECKNSKIYRLTPQLAAQTVLGAQQGPELMRRFCEAGGFCANPDMPVPDLLSTAVALFALRTLNTDLDAMREPCLNFVESLWRDSGGFAGHVTDEIEDIEYTFYALLSIGCLVTRKDTKKTRRIPARPFLAPLRSISISNSEVVARV